MILSDLLQALEGCRIMGPDPAGVEISALTCDSRRVGPGSLFAALKGAKSDGHRFLADAVAAGAAALLVERPEATLESVPQIVAPDTRPALARLAHSFHGEPTRGLRLVGLTGTNGKTTLSYLIEAMLTAADPGRPVGVMGTVETRWPGVRRPSALTTPESVDLVAALAEMHDNGAGQAVMEVSSHALDQHRAEGCLFDLAVFTNLSRDHLDYHPDLEAYFAAKARLFNELLPHSLEAGKRPAALVCLDDPYGRRLAGRLSGGPVPVFTYGFDEEADLRVEVERADLAGTSCRLTASPRLSAAWSEARAVTPLVGRHNAQNLCGAVAAGLALGLDSELLLAGAQQCAGVPGRLERVGGDALPAVFVDYAHTDQALAGVLAALRPLTPRRLICVFGAGGDRDQGKRPLMGRAVGSAADLAVLTSDNPRTEEPLAIMTMIEPGLIEAGAARLAGPDQAAAASGRVYLSEPDRAAAIALAVSLAGRDDVVLIAGKGHEDYQIVGTTKRHFDDREQALAALGTHGARAAGGGHGQA